MLQSLDLERLGNKEGPRGNIGISRGRRNRHLLGGLEVGGHGNLSDWVGEWAMRRRLRKMSGKADLEGVPGRGLM